MKSTANEALRRLKHFAFYPFEVLTSFVGGSALGFWILGLVVRFVSKSRRQLVFCPTPLINNKYWSQALREAGHDAITLVTHHYPANKRSDFDVYYDDIAVARLGRAFLRYRYVRDLVAFLYVIGNARVVHVPFTGGPLGATPFWRHEAALYKIAGIRIVVIPYGGDAHMYSAILNTSMRNALLIDYPSAARNEHSIRERVNYWASQADCVICGALIYGMSRWDVTTPSPLCLNIFAIEPKRDYSMSDGAAVPVRVIHAPNHRGFKGTEFIIQAVDELKAEGLKIDFRLLEGVPNDRVMETLRDADILVEQLIAGAYALNAIEGMACGVAVLSSLDDQPRNAIFRRYSFAEECPILSTTPETIKTNLRLLVVNPALRRELGQAGRQFVEKYHSYNTAQYLFESVYAKIVDGKEIDLMNLFHPLKSKFNKQRARVNHPLKGGLLPPEYPVSSV
jgi:glycosyltransferase involved in cell wall biosynthesis